MSATELAVPPAKTPSDRRWKYEGMCGDAQSWKKGRVRALTECTVMEYPDGDGKGPTWLVSFSLDGERLSGRPLDRALSDFGMSDAEEDNHHPGVARHFFMPVDPAHRVDCECKSDETIIVEADGYTWSNSKDGPCRGCELERLSGMKCPIHV